MPAAYPPQKKLSSPRHLKLHLLLSPPIGSWNKRFICQCTQKYRIYISIFCNSWNTFLPGIKSTVITNLYIVFRFTLILSNTHIVATFTSGSAEASIHESLFEAVGSTFTWTIVSIVGSGTIKWVSVTSFGKTADNFCSGSYNYATQKLHVTQVLQKLAALQAYLSRNNK